MIDNYLIQVIPEGDQFLARVSEETGMDQREGASYTLRGVALEPTKEDAIYNAIQSAFFVRAT